MQKWPLYRKAYICPGKWILCGHTKVNESVKPADSGLHGEFYV